MWVVSGRGKIKEKTIKKKINFKLNFNVTSYAICKYQNWLTLILYFRSNLVVEIFQNILYKTLLARSETFLNGLHDGKRFVEVFQEQLHLTLNHSSDINESIDCSKFYTHTTNHGIDTKTICFQANFCVHWQCWGPRKAYKEIMEPCPWKTSTLT